MGMIEFEKSSAPGGICSNDPNMALLFTAMLFYSLCHLLKLYENLDFLLEWQSGKFFFPQSFCPEKSLENLILIQDIYS